MYHFSKYWIFQISGWSIFVLFNIYISFLTKEISYPIVIINILLGLAGIFLSHFYRQYLVRMKWQLFNTEKLIFYVLLASFVLAICYIFIYYFFSFVFFKTIFNYIGFQQIVGSFIAIFCLFSIWNAFYFAWKYIEKNRQQLINRLKLEGEKKDLEIKTIRANLQPHFIFNSLNSIRALIDEDPLLARCAITKISNILRNSISFQEDTNTLENELSIVDDYLDLEKIRYEERLIVFKKIEENTLQIQVPTMMLQTLVENAIKHGIAMSERGGELFISAYIHQQKLLLEIINTGQISNINKNDNSLGFGLSSSKQRLKLLYNEDNLLQINQKNEYVIVTINIPFRK